jgi:hypothetical protein
MFILRRAEKALIFILLWWPYLITPQTELNDISNKLIRTNVDVNPALTQPICSYQDIYSIEFLANKKAKSIHYERPGYSPYTTSYMSIIDPSLNSTQLSLEAEEALIMRQVLVNILRSVRAAIRTTSLLTRIGGDTFAGVLSGVVKGFGGVCNLLAEILRSISGLMFQQSDISTGNATVVAELRSVGGNVSSHLTRLAHILGIAPPHAFIHRS